MRGNIMDEKIIEMSKLIGKLEERTALMAIINDAGTLYDIKNGIRKYLDEEKELERECKK